jgi:hypothetical protein
MNTKIALRPQATIQQIIEQILRTGKITRADENMLYGVMRSEGFSLSGEELLQVRLVLERLQWGLLKVVE